MKFNTKEELVKYTENIKGKTFKEIDSEHLLDNSKSNRNKGILGQIVETGFYKYPLNNNSEADFEELGIELKVSGYIKNKDGSIHYSTNGLNLKPGESWTTKGNLKGFGTMYTIIGKSSVKGNYTFILKW